MRVIVTITEVDGELYRQVRESMLVPYSTTSITVAYEDLHHYHCKLLTVYVDLCYSHARVR